MKVIKLIILFALTTQVLSNDGIWTGIFDINGHGKYDFTGLISDQMATAYTEKAKVVYKGKITTYKNKFKWNLSMYLKDGNKFGTAEITGKIIDGNIMSGKWVTEPAKDYGNIYLIKDKSNVASGAKKIINKSWISIENKILHTLIIKDFLISGKDSNNCNYYGKLQILNEEIYGIDFDIASCGISDGTYSGMAYVDKKNNLVINAISNNFSLFLKLK